MAATLAAGGKNPVTGKQVMDADKVPGVLAVMATAGLYDDSGKWLYHTGLPAKSGVGGGIIAVSPGKFGIAVVSPPLDDAGNSVRAQRAIADISNALGGNPYAAAKTVSRQADRCAAGDVTHLLAGTFRCDVSSRADAIAGRCGRRPSTQAAHRHRRDRRHDRGRGRVDDGRRLQVRRRRRRRRSSPPCRR